MNDDTAEKFRHVQDLMAEGVARKVACREVGIPDSTVRGWERRQQTPEVQFPTIPDDDLEAGEILDHLEASFHKQAAYHEAITWFTVHIHDDKPIGICWFGDPHLGSPGCNIPLLRRDIGIVNDTPGMYAANIGDTVDNWGGRLLRLYSETTMTRSRERKLASWFLQETGLPWLVWLLGNHEHMDGAFEAHIKAMNGNVIPMMDWRAQFKVKFSNDAEVRIDAAHDFKGHSLWNEMHALDRAAITEGTADLFIAGHRHTWGIKIREIQERLVTLVRTRGYKFHDEFAVRKGFDQQMTGASIVTVLDPKPRSPVEKVRAFADVEEGAEYLTYKRR